MSDTFIFQTPKPLKKGKKRGQDNLSPFVIPASPRMKILGYGTGVNVYLIERFSPLKGSYKSPWAVKKICRRMKGNSEICKRLETEAKTLKSLNHPNIIGYRSFTKSEDNTSCLVMEAGSTSLNDIIEERTFTDSEPISAENILKVAKSIASALSYLHHECFILHGDLKSHNILVKGDFEEVKLCDFGVCVPLNKDLSAINNEDYVGTECWCAPEIFQCSTVTNKSDIFSFGLVLWEMLALTAPHTDQLDIDYDGVDEEEIKRLEDLNAIEFEKNLGTRPIVPGNFDDSYSKILELFFVCTEEKPSSRPSAKDIMDVYFS